MGVHCSANSIKSSRAGHSLGQWRFMRSTRPALERTARTCCARGRPLYCNRQYN